MVPAEPWCCFVHLLSGGPVGFWARPGGFFVGFVLTFIQCALVRVNSSQTLPTSLPIQLPVFFLLKCFKTNLQCPNILRCVIFSWNISAYQRLPFKRELFHSLPVANNCPSFHGWGWDCVPDCLRHVGIWSGTSLFRFCTSKFLGAATLLCPHVSCSGAPSMAL